MKARNEKRVAARMARIMAMLSMRNMQLQTRHAGMTTATRTCDCSGLLTVEADGGRIHWTEISRLAENDMCA